MSLIVYIRLAFQFYTVAVFVYNSSDAESAYQFVCYRTTI